MRTFTLSAILALLSCFPSCLLHAQQVEALPEYNRAGQLLDVKPDSSYYYYSEVAQKASDSLVIAGALNGMAVLLANQGDYVNSLEKLIASLKYLRENNPRDSAAFASDYNEMGNACVNLKRYDDAIRYFKIAQQFGTKEEYKLTYLNGEALAYRQKGDYGPAIDIYDSILSRFKTEDNNYARVLSNLAKTKWLNDQHYNPTTEFWKALAIRLKENDQWGINASYAHLSDYYENVNRDSANFYARKMYDVAMEIGSPEDQLEALDKMIRNGPPSQVAQYYAIYKNVDDRLRGRRDTVRNQFALTAYEVEKNKMSLASSQSENERKSLQIVRQRLVILISLLIFTAVSFFAVAWYQKRKQRLRLEAEDKIRDYRLKTSQKVHDVVANGLYRVMTTIEHRDDVTKEELLDSIELLYEQSRDISYDQLPGTEVDFYQSVNRLLSSFANENLKVWIAGNDPSVWEHTTNEARNTLARVLEELMVNMRKHSSAKNVTIKIEKLSNELKITYRDDGIGMHAGVKKGNGLVSTGNRINGLGGRIIFEPNDGNGLVITISTPLSKTK